MRGILDDTKLEGVADVSTSLRPHRIAELMPTEDLDTFIQRIAFNCEAWGGGGTVLVPSSAGEIPEPYRTMLVASDVDRIESAIPGHEFKAPRWLSNGMGRRHPALLIVNGMKERKDWHPFRVPELEKDDPWLPIYAATLGAWPAQPSSEMFPDIFYREPPESFEMFFDVTRERIAGSIDDLVERLTGSNTNYPRRLTTVRLAHGLLPDTTFLGGGGGVFPQKHATRRAAGPNIVVVFGEDPVADGALLWNLRGAHTPEYALPIGLPHPEVNAQTLMLLQQPGNAAMFGLGGGKIYLTSVSVPLEDLSQLAEQHRGASVVPWQELLAFGPAPSIPRTQIAIFDDGRARIVPLNERDLEAIYPFGRSGMTPSLQLAVAVDRDPIPVCRTLRGDGMSGSFFAAGSAQVSVPSSTRESRTSEVEWPTGWLRLQCVAKDLRLDVEVSAPGRAALALLEAIGGVGQIYWLCHPDLIRLFYRLAERSGMTWWKQRWTQAKQQLMAEGAEEAIEEVAERVGRDSPAVAPTGEGRELGFEEFVKALGNDAKAAENWMRWAEPRHLVVRGANVQCNQCSASSWLPIGAIPSIITCSGCGRVIDKPFPPRHLEFRYRLGEVLRRALEVDCLDHLFALRYFTRLLDRQGLVGAHPGINFRERGSASVTAEADVVLLFADGSIVPGEVKRTGAGVTPAEVEKLTKVVARLNAPWSFLAIGQTASDCKANVPAAESRDDDRPRFVVTTDQTYDSHPMLTLDADPLRWDPDPDRLTKHAARFVSSLAQRSPEEPWSMQEVIYLERDDHDEDDRAEDD